MAAIVSAVVQVGSPVLAEHESWWDGQTWTAFGTTQVGQYTCAKIVGSGTGAVKYSACVHSKGHMFVDALPHGECVDTWPPAGSAWCYHMDNAAWSYSDGTYVWAQTNNHGFTADCFQHNGCSTSTVILHVVGAGPDAPCHYHESKAIGYFDPARLVPAGSIAEQGGEACY